MSVGVYSDSYIRMVRCTMLLYHTIPIDGRLLLSAQCKCLKGRVERGDNSDFVGRPRNDMGRIGCRLRLSNRCCPDSSGTYLGVSKSGFPGPCWGIVSLTSCCFRNACKAVRHSFACNMDLQDHCRAMSLIQSIFTHAQWLDRME